MQRNIKPFQPMSIQDKFFQKEFSGVGVLRRRTDEFGEELDSYALNVLTGEAPRLALTVNQSTVDLFNLPVGTAFLYKIALNTNEDKQWSDEYGPSYTVLSEGMTLSAMDVIALKKDKTNKVTIYPVYGISAAENERFNKALIKYDAPRANVMDSKEENETVPAEDDNAKF